MNLPPGLIAAEHAATIFTAEAKMIYQGKVIDYKDKEEELSSRLSNKTLPKPWINQLYFEVITIEEGVNAIYGRRSGRALVNVVKIDENRRFCTVQYISGKQSTYKVTSLRMENPHLVPIHFSCYKSIQEETKLYYSKTMKDFQPNYLESSGYEARVHAGEIYAFRKDSPVIEAEPKKRLLVPTEEMPEIVKKFNKIELTKDPGIINTHWADKLAIRMLEGKRDIIDKQIENIETKIYESENPDK